MVRKGLGRWLQSPLDRYVERFSARVAELGWAVAPGDDVHAVYSGRAGDGSEFVVRAQFGDDGSNDYLEWWGGPLRLDALLLAVTNRPERDRRWLARVEVRGGLAHDGDPDPKALRDALNAKAAEGASPKELNDYALELGAGGATGVVMRFERNAAEVDSGIPELQALAGAPGVAESMLTETVRARLAAVASQASGRLGPATFLAFAGVPFSKVYVETRGATIELLREIAELGSELRARADASTR